MRTTILAMLAIIASACSGDPELVDPCEGLASGSTCTWLGLKGEQGFNGDHHRVETVINQAQDLVFLPDGTAWFSDFNNYLLRRVVIDVGHDDAQVAGGKPPGRHGHVLVPEIEDAGEPRLQGNQVGSGTAICQYGRRKGRQRELVRRALVVAQPAGHPRVAVKGVGTEGLDGPVRQQRPRNAALCRRAPLALRTPAVEAVPR